MRIIRVLMTSMMVLAVTVSAAFCEDLKIAVVNMDLLIKSHQRTKADTVILEKYIEDYQAERDEMAEALRALGTELEELGKEVADTALSDKAREEKRTLARAKLEEYQDLKLTLREVTTKRQKELTSQELLMRTRVVSEIKKIIKEIADKKNISFVLDSEGMGRGAYSTVLYSPENVDITDDIIAAMPAEDTE